MCTCAPASAPVVPSRRSRPACCISQRKTKQVHEEAGVYRQLLVSDAPSRKVEQAHMETIAVWELHFIPWFHLVTLV